SGVDDCDGTAFTRNAGRLPTFRYDVATVGDRARPAMRMGGNTIRLFARCADRAVILDIDAAAIAAGDNDDASRLFPGRLDRPVIHHNGFIPAASINAGAVLAGSQDIFVVPNFGLVPRNGGDAIGPV